MSRPVWKEFTTLDEYDLVVEDLEAGRVPAGFTDLVEAASSLCARLCKAPWNPGEERERAQVLALRLGQVQERHGRG
jgi:hypothetical protein